MLSKAKTLKGYKLRGLDGEIGTVKEFYFDDHRWTVRYLVADSGTWLTDQMVLISPYALNRINQADQHILIDLTKKQIENSPSLESHKPVSQQFESDYYGYYGWPPYWNGSSTWGDTAHIERDREKWVKSSAAGKPWDRHLRSTREVSGYYIQALDGEIGHVEDFVIDDETWAIRYLVAATKNWWPGKQVLISTGWIDRVSWSDSKVFINLTREGIQGSPPFTEDTLLSRDVEMGLHRHYRREGYWVEKRVGVEVKGSC